ncbi:MAG TPA: protein translocase subunit SecF [bacterium]|nr:protein translocase subunit SecF [bacterium]
MFNIVKPNTNYDFVKASRIGVIASVIVIGIMMFVFFTKGLNYGVDFTGGIEMQVKFEDASVDSQKLRTVMQEIKSGDVQVQKFSDATGNEYLIRVKGSEADLNVVTKDIELKLETTFSKGTYDIRKIEIVGPKVGEELKLSAIYALIYAMLGIFIYIAIRFDYKFSPGAIVALIHDVLFTVGIFAITGYQFTLSTVAALLAIVGYSVNDTIVIYDRIREVMDKHKGMSLPVMINKALNETLSRTILTTLVTFLCVLMIFIFGGSSLRDFSLALVVGMVSGVYSTVFIASPVILLMDRLFGKKKAE